MRLPHLFLCFAIPLFASVDIQVDVSSGRRPISPFLYGRNNSLSDDPGRPLKASDWQFLRDAGVRILRENGGNNSTKYNWRLKLSSHPDWYNNVYRHDWDYTAKSLQNNMSEAGGVFALQLLGMAAGDNSHNFNDWGYNRSQWWEGVNNNWAGGGGPDIGEGDPSLYLTDWPADSTAGILDHWFGPEGLGLDPDRFRYWNMDNEPEVWNGTHDDVVTVSMPVEEYLQSYFAVAKKARAKFPGVKLLGPVSTNEWQWYNWNNDKVQSGGKSYVWLEYFIKRIGDEQQATGTRLLDVLDLHFYPGEQKPSELVQLHRVWFDRTYNYPGANGVKRAGSGGWDNGITKEYVFGRCREWLERYLGLDHGVGLGVSEMGIAGDDPNVVAVWYASTLGVFADEGVELFTPWSWKQGMWEVLHLFTRYAKGYRVASASGQDALVSAYASVNSASDSMTVILVNRDLTKIQEASVHTASFEIPDGDYRILSISGLPSGSESFKSHSDNALQEGTTAVRSGSFALSLPALSVTAVLLSGYTTGIPAREPDHPGHPRMDVYPNPFNATAVLSYRVPRESNVRIELYDSRGRRVRTLRDERQQPGSFFLRLGDANLASGVYVVRYAAGMEIVLTKVLLIK
jgi:hypothetical protein